MACRAGISCVKETSVKSHCPGAAAEAVAVNIVMLSVTPWLNEVEDPFVIFVVEVEPTPANVPPDGSTVSRPAEAAPLKSMACEPSDQVAVLPVVAATVIAQVAVLVGFVTRIFSDAAPSVPVEVWVATEKFLPAKLTDGLLTESPELSTMSTFNVPDIDWLNVLEELADDFTGQKQLTLTNASNITLTTNALPI